MARGNLASTPAGPGSTTTSTASSSTASSGASGVTARSPGFLGTVMGKLQGLHKNPIKHAAFNLGAAIVEHRDADLPKAVQDCEAAMVFYRGGQAPVNDRNPYFAIFMDTFVPFAKDTVKMNTGGTVTEAEARVGLLNVNSFIGRAGPVERQINTSHRSKTSTDEINAFINSTVDILVRAKGFYQHILRPFNAAKRAAKEAANAAASKAVAANMQARLNKLKGMHGGATKKKRSARKTKTRRA